MHVGAVEENGEVVFLHKVLEGPAEATEFMWRNWLTYRAFENEHDFKSFRS